MIFVIMILILTGTDFIHPQKMTKDKLVTNNCKVALKTFLLYMGQRRYDVRIKINVQKGFYVHRMHIKCK